MLQRPHVKLTQGAISLFEPFKPVWQDKALSMAVGRGMQTPAEYRAQAGQCVRQAEHAKTSKRRLVLLQMAQTLVRMANEAEALNKADLDEAS